MRLTKDRISKVARTMMDSTIHIPSGFSDFDKLCLGFSPGEMVVIAGRPSMGKTAYMINLVLNISDHHRVLIESAEMSTQALAERMICILARVNSLNIKHGMISEDERHRLNMAGIGITDRLIYVNDDPIISLEKLEEDFCRDNPEIIFIDYLQILRTVRGNARHEEISNITQDIALFAKRTNVPVVLLSQLNRECEQRPDKTPRLSDLRDSGMIEQAADKVLFVHRPAYYSGEDDGQAYIILAKNRNGPTGKMVYQWLAEYGSFCEIPEDYKEELL